MMETQGLLWFSPVVPVRGANGMTHNVSNVQAAAEVLLQWPKRGPKWALAMRACMGALAGEVTPQEARRVFRLAAKEEGMLRENLDGKALQTHSGIH
jgi:Protein of unknown function (DUF982)